MRFSNKYRSLSFESIAQTPSVSAPIVCFWRNLKTRCEYRLFQDMRLIVTSATLNTIHVSCTLIRMHIVTQHMNAPLILLRLKLRAPKRKRFLLCLFRLQHRPLLRTNPYNPPTRPSATPRPVLPAPDKALRESRKSAEHRRSLSPSLTPLAFTVHHEQES